MQDKKRSNEEGKNDRFPIHFTRMKHLYPKKNFEQKCEFLSTCIIEMDLLNTKKNVWYS